MKKVVSIALATIIAITISASSLANINILMSPDLINIERDTPAGGLIKVVGYHWVNPYFRKDGTFVRGHLRSNPDGVCWNNLSGC